ncbi:hypothetical protein, partial [Parabacteroides sp.]
RRIRRVTQILFIDNKISLRYSEYSALSASGLLDLTRPLLFVDMFLNIHARNQLVSRKCLSLSYPDVNAYNMLVI